MNVELLQRVKEHILEEPRRFRMERYVAPPDYFGLEGEAAPPCGTVACIAGWAMILSEQPESPLTDDYYCHVRDDAPRLFGLEYYQASRLFNLASWPQPFQDDYRQADDPQERAEIAARRIDRFIATDGAE